MAVEYKLAYTGAEIDARLAKIDEIDELKELVGTTPVEEQIAEQINQAVPRIYAQANQPGNDAPNGSIWIKI